MCLPSYTHFTIITQETQHPGQLFLLWGITHVTDCTHWYSSDAGSQCILLFWPDGGVTPSGKRELQILSTNETLTVCIKIIKNNKNAIHKVGHYSEVVYKHHNLDLMLYSVWRMWMFTSLDSMTLWAEINIRSQRLITFKNVHPIHCSLCAGSLFYTRLWEICQLLLLMWL